MRKRGTMLSRLSKRTTTSSWRRRVAKTPRQRVEATVTDRGLCRRGIPERAYAPPRRRFLDADDPATSGGLCLRPNADARSAEPRQPGDDRIRQERSSPRARSRRSYGDAAIVRFRPCTRRRSALAQCRTSTRASRRGCPVIVRFPTSAEPSLARRLGLLEPRRTHAFNCDEGGDRPRLWNREPRSRRSGPPSRTA